MSERMSMKGPLAGLAILALVIVALGILADIVRP
jgi:hypothetical protein